MFKEGSFMNEKDTQIIEAGMKLFATKGFSATSVQEIATESGISKGSFYLHFKSKDDLLLAILQHQFAIISQAFDKQTATNQSPREKFIHQQAAWFSHFINHREFFIMLAKEQAIPRNETVKKLLFKKQMEAHRYYRQSMLDIYGANIEDYSWDLTFLIDGMIHSYMRVILLSNQDVDLTKLANFILSRMDSIVKDIHNDTPLLTNDKANELLSRFLFDNETNLEKIVANLEEEIQKLDEEELFITLQVIKEEVTKEKPRIPVIQGMLSNFDDYPSLHHYRNIILGYYANKQ